MVLAVMLSLLIFIGEAVRDAFDPRKTQRRPCRSTEIGAMRAASAARGACASGALDARNSLIRDRTALGPGDRLRCGRARQGLGCDDPDAGETVGLVGESGSGKSVTALSILQLLPYPLAHHPGGSIRFFGAATRVLRGNGSAEERS